MTLSFLKEEVNIEKEKIKELINITKHCLRQNIFNFNDGFYEQTNGAAMGNQVLFFF